MNVRLVYMRYHFIYRYRRLCDIALSTKESVGRPIDILYSPILSYIHPRPGLLDNRPRSFSTFGARAALTMLTTDLAITRPVAAVKAGGVKPLLLSPRPD